MSDWHAQTVETEVICATNVEKRGTGQQNAVINQNV